MTLRRWQGVKEKGSLNYVAQAQEQAEKGGKEKREREPDVRNI